MSIYSDVKEILTADTWYKGDAFRNDSRGTRMCILGARAFVEYNILDYTIEDDERIYHKLAGIIKEQFPERVEKREVANEFQFVTLFNDNNATTLADIHLILEKADADES